MFVLMLSVLYYLFGLVFIYITLQWIFVDEIATYWTVIGLATIWPLILLLLIVGVIMSGMKQLGKIRIIKKLNNRIVP